MEHVNTQNIGKCYIEFISQEKLMRLILEHNLISLFNSGRDTIVRTLKEIDASYLYVRNSGSDVSVHSWIGGKERRQEFDLENEDEDLRIDRAMNHALKDVDIFIEENDN